MLVGFMASLVRYPAAFALKAPVPFLDPYISMSLPIPPYLSLSLPISPYISLYLLHHALVLLQHLGDVLVVLLLEVRDSGQSQGW